MAKLCSNQLELEINFDFIAVCLPECFQQLNIIMFLKYRESFTGITSTYNGYSSRRI